MIGASVRRLEDGPLLRGQGRFVADLVERHDLHLRIVRSSVAHGRIRSIDARSAARSPGVVWVITASDLPSDLPRIAVRQVSYDEMTPYLQPVLAADRVRYVGEPVAAVVATDAYLAEDAADLVEVEIEEFPAHLDPVATPAEWDDEGHLTEALVLHEEYGEVDAAFERATTIVEVEVAVGRHSGVPLETRGARAHVVAETGVLVVEGAAKVQHYNRRALAHMLGVALDRVELHEGHVGGGFGIRGELYPEDVLVAWVALRLRRPVAWIEDRQEHLVAANHSRDQVHRLRAAVDASGHIAAIEDEFWLDQGAYVRTHGATVPTLTLTMLPGPYRVPAYRATGRVRLTNKTPAGTYRAPGRYEGTFARERLVDAIAARLSLDPIEIRRRNFVQPSEMPFTRPMSVLGTEIVYDSGDYPRLAERLVEHVDMEALATDLRERRRAGELVGAGVAAFVEKSGLGPFEGAEISVDPDGTVRVLTGVASVGQGVETVVAQIAAATLGVDYRNVRVCHGQTDEMVDGFGAFATRATVMAGSAAHLAAEAVRAKAIQIVAEMLEAAPEDLELSGGSVSVRGTPARSVTLGAVAAAVDPSGARRYGVSPGLAEQAWFHSTHMTYPYGIQLAVVRVDAGTGGVEILRFVAAYDIGRAVNPMLVEGQIRGGAAQGIGGALSEEFTFDDDGQPQSTSFMDYLMPTAAEIPDIEVVLTEDAPSPLNPLGVKGAGEGGTNAAGAAIAAAIDDAIGVPGAVRRLPVHPRVLWDLLRSTR